jgi:hypothetical protein
MHDPSLIFSATFARGLDLANLPQPYHRAVRGEHSKIINSIVIPANAGI